ncbi:hypothetical protein GGS20DRAFT_595147 [Poronia punctata]|nr:hypothetical protein GGS20DRAFT_595147 [Poronia punctata]
MSFPHTLRDEHSPINILEFRLRSDGLETKVVRELPLTAWHAANNPVFGRFTALPLELRLKVWEYFIVPRIVEIACFGVDESGYPLYDFEVELGSRQQGITPSAPVLLYVNRETRSLALKHYELSFEWKGSLVPTSQDRSPARALYPVPTSAPPPPPESVTSTQDSRQNESAPVVSSYHELLGELQGGGGGAVDTPCVKGTKVTPRSGSPPRTWFNFGLDAVYLVGALEPMDSFGFSNPMPYLIPSQTTRRVRKTAVAFSALDYGSTGPQQIFGTLFHVIDRFQPVDDEVLVCVTLQDERIHLMLGNETPLVGDKGATDGSGPQGDDGTPGTEAEMNILQTIWRDWYRGSIVTSPLAKIKFVLIREEDMEGYLYDWAMRNPGPRKKTSVAGDTVGR